MQTASCAFSSPQVSLIRFPGERQSAILNWQSSMSLCPLQRAFAPRVVITDNQNADKDEHLDQRELGEREILAHENDRPGQEEDRLNVENQKQHRDDVVTHCEAFVRAGYRIDAALVRPHLVLLIFHRSKKAAEYQT